MSTVKKVTPEVSQLLKTMPTDILMAFSQIERNKELYAAFRLVLDSLLKDRQGKIVSSAASVSSMDTLIDMSINQSFYRGQIAMTVLINSLIKNAPDYLEKRGEGETKGKSK